MPRGMVLALAMLCSVPVWPATFVRGGSVLRNVAQDQTGVLWAIQDWNESGLLRWEDGWQPAGYAPGGGQAAALGHGADGGVLCLWLVTGADEARSLQVSRHSGDESEPIRDIAAADSPFLTYTAERKTSNPLTTLRNTAVFEDSAGNLWLLYSGCVLVRHAQDGTVEVVYDDVAAPRPPGVRSRPRTWFDRPPQVVEDGIGGVWFWEPDGPMQGLVRTTASETQHLPAVPGLPAGPIADVLRKEAGLLWVAVPEAGIFAIDAAGLTATPVPVPDAAAFKNGRALYLLEGDVYLESKIDRDETLDFRMSFPLWRWRNGEWQCITVNLDAFMSYTLWQRRPLTATPEGLWIGTQSCCGWLFPKGGGEGIRLDWQRGARLGATGRLFALETGEVLALDTANRDASVMRASEILQAPHAIEADRLIGAWLMQGCGRVWRYAGATPPTLEWWNDAAWQEVPVPESEARFEGMGTDNRDRVWLISELLTAILETDTGRWESYPTYRFALRQAWAQDPEFALDAMVFPFTPDAANPTPAVTKDGRIAFVNPFGQINYFDGRTWHHSLRGAGFGTATAPASSQWPPWFSESGALCVEERDPMRSNARRYWILDGSTWRMSEDATLANPSGSTLNRPEPPPYLTMERPDSLVVDTEGVYWLTWESALYRAAEGHCTPVYPADLATPFLEGHRLYDALSDGRGNVFLQLTSSKYGVPQYFLVRATDYLGGSSGESAP